MNEFCQQFKEIRSALGFSLEQMGASLGYSGAFLCDIEHARRTPSVKFTNNLCDWLGRGQQGRVFWHRLGAKAHGWEIDVGD